MITRDADVIWRPGRIYIPAWSFSGLRYSALGSGQASAATISSATAATNSFAIEISGTTGFTALKTSSMGDAVNHLMQVPYDLDVRYPINVAVWWTVNSTDNTDTVTWAVTYKEIVRDTTIMTTPFLALDTTIALDTYPSASAFVAARTPYGIINGDTIDKNTEMIGWRLAMTTHAADAQPQFLGMELVYTPKRFYYQDGMRHAAKLNTNILGDVSAN